MKEKKWPSTMEWKVYGEKEKVIVLCVTHRPFSMFIDVVEIVQWIGIINTNIK